MIESVLTDTVKDIGSTSSAEPIDRILDSVKVVGLAGLGGADEMRRKLEESAAIRKVIEDFIVTTFIKGTDYGIADHRSPKETLLKPGAEKVCHLFDTHPEWHRDNETWEMLGKPSGVVCLKCLIVDNKTGKIIGEGRGAERVGNKDRDANKAIKNAEKCALVDAALYTFMLSNRFTQDGGKGTTDLEEMKKNAWAELQEWRSGCNSSMTDAQFLMKVLQRILHKKSISTKAELELFRKSVLENHEFDKETGDKIGE